MRSRLGYVALGFLTGSLVSGCGNGTSASHSSTKSSPSLEERVSEQTSVSGQPIPSIEKNEVASRQDKQSYDSRTVGPKGDYPEIWKLLRENEGPYVGFEELTPVSPETAIFENTGTRYRSVENGFGGRLAFPLGREDVLRSIDGTYVFAVGANRYVVDDNGKILTANPGHRIARSEEGDIYIEVGGMPLEKAFAPTRLEDLKGALEGYVEVREEKLEGGEVGYGVYLISQPRNE